MELTADQIEAVKKGEPVRVSAPEIGVDCMLIRADRLDRLCGSFSEAEDRALQVAWLKASHESAVSWMRENPC